MTWLLFLPAPIGAGHLEDVFNDFPMMSDIRGIKEGGDDLIGIGNLFLKPNRCFQVLELIDSITAFVRMVSKQVDLLATNKL